MNKEIMSHPMWVRGLKLLVLRLYVSFSLSHPMWVRGLKPEPAPVPEPAPSSHPMWVRGLKLYKSIGYDSTFGRILCGCVD